MIDRVRLLKDLQKQVTRVERDLQGQLAVLPDVDERLRAEHRSAFKAGRTSASATQWLGERLTQTAVAWVLGTVFVRFCEDNFLVRHPYMAGPTSGRQTHAQERHDEFMAGDASRTHCDWLLRAFGEIAASSAGRLLFDERHNPLYRLRLSHEGAKALIDFWRLHEEVGGNTRIAHDFCDPEWDTRFLGDLYQELSEEAKDKYALLQTPEFVEEFILDRTLKKALRQTGYDVIRMIDPTCGSGHFLLGAFQRILEAWEEKAPGDDVHTRVGGALNAVHGVDINPFAVAIARFRLLVAALKAAGVKTLREASNHEWPLHIATGDALLKSRQGKLFEGSSEEGDAEGEFEFWFETEDLAEHENLLKPGTYHVVVGNPPYIAVKDSGLRDTYRRLYRNVCHGRYVLSVPFMQRFFELAVRGEDGKVEPGHVGQITSNSFMKREFGEKLVEGFLKNAVDLTEVIDSSGAYIPGHGTPTVIVIGRNQLAALGARTVRTVRGVQGEPETPKSPKRGLVWRDIVARIDEPGRSAGRWVSAADLDREMYFGHHPWILADGGVETIQALGENARGKLKRSMGASVGITSVTGEDDLFLLPGAGATERLKVKLTRPVVTGDSVRDHRVTSEFSSIWMYGEEFNVLPLSELGAASRILWMAKSIICRRKRFGTPMVERGLAWYEWQELYVAKLKSPLSITFAEVATHNHFSLDRGGKVFKQTAPVIKLPSGASEGEYLKILGVMNSSASCFWLKQMCHSKGSAVDKKGARQSKAPFDDFYQFNSTNVQEFPLPVAYPLVRATELDALAQQLGAVSPAKLTSEPEKPPTAKLLEEAKAEWYRLRSRMIAVQEEIDWEVYGIYGLYDDLTAPLGALPVDGLELGQRAFEIDLGNLVTEQGVKTEWFRRHNSTMITDIPASWPKAYQDTVRRRLEAMRNSAVIGLIERPEYKRRWLTDGWDKQQAAALREWLLTRMEKRDLWFETDYSGVERPRTRSLTELVDDLSADSDFTDVAALYAPGKEVAEIVPELVNDRHVPFLAALRYQEPVLKKKREVWEQVWEQQRAEDEATAAKDHFKAMEIRNATPVPPKYTTKDFRKDSYAAQRGGLDVPKERFISYSRTLSPAIEVLGWGGWDHEEQAVALTETIQAREASGNWEREDFVPYLAGLLELLFWVKQWHPEAAGVYEEALADWQHEEAFSVTTEQLRAWRPAPPGRGKGSKASKKVPAKETPAEMAE